MVSIPRIAKEVKQFFEEEAPALARAVGMRQRTIPFSKLAMILILGWWQHPSAGQSALARFAGSLGLSLKKQNIDCHLNERTSQWLLALLQRIVRVMVSSNPSEIALLRRFRAVLVEDGSVITLPHALQEVWRGCGGGSRSKDHSRAKASLKITVRFNVLTGDLHGPYLQDGRSHELSSVLREQVMSPGSLWMADLGYWTLKWLRRLNEAGVYFLLRYKPGILLWSEGKRLNLLERLPQEVGQSQEWLVDVGEGKLMRNVRLLAHRVPDDVASLREKRYREHAQAHSKPVTAQTVALMKWTLVVTNVPQSLLTCSQAFLFLHARWQIELLFKLWKQEALVDQWASEQPWKVVCEVYAKLIAVVLQHWFLLLSCWDDPHRSLFSTAEVIRENLPLLVQGRCHRLPLQRVIRLLVQCVGGGCSIEQRATRLSTSHLLQSALDSC